MRWPQKYIPFRFLYYPDVCLWLRWQNWQHLIIIIGTFLHIFLFSVRYLRYNFCIASGWHEDMTYLQWGIDVTNAVPITQLGPGAELQLLNQSVTRKSCALLWTVDTRVLQLWYRYSIFTIFRKPSPTGGLIIKNSEKPLNPLRSFQISVPILVLSTRGSGRILPQVLCTYDDVSV